MTTEVESVASPKEMIFGLIAESTDDALGGKKSCWRDKSYLGNIFFGDVMDVVLLYVSLQPDLIKIANIKTYDFYALLEETWKEWEKTAEKQWGYKYYKYPRNSDQKHRISRFYDISDAWSSGPGPMGGTMGAAEHYAYLSPGFLQHNYLLAFFSYPAGLPDEAGNWPAYRKNRIEAHVLPKWRRRKHTKKLEMVLQLAEMVCGQMRKT